MPRNNLTQKQERFTLNLFQGLSQRESWIQAGYSSNYSPAIVDTNACVLANSTKVKIRLAELRQAADDVAVSTVVERKKILTEIQRARFGDFADENGNLDITDKAKLQNAAVQEIKTEKTLMGIRTTLKLRDPVAAITEHNKMDKIYSDGQIVNLNINVEKAIIDASDKFTNLINSRTARIGTPEISGQSDSSGEGQPAIRMGILGAGKPAPAE